MMTFHFQGNQVIFSFDLSIDKQEPPKFNTNILFCDTEFPGTLTFELWMQHIACLFWTTTKILGWIKITIFRAFCQRNLLYSVFCLFLFNKMFVWMITTNLFWFTIINKENTDTFHITYRNNFLTVIKNSNVFQSNGGTGIWIDIV